jgi:hypothetical protein
MEVRAEPIVVSECPKTARLPLLLVMENLKQELFTDLGVPAVRRENVEKRRKRFVFES